MCIRDRGYNEKDTERTWAWRYRDYVVNAFNKDLPWDQFIREQLAGDEMVKPPHTELQPDQIDKLTATGYLRMAPDGTGTANNNDARNQVMAETLKIVSSSLMGVTVGCAQCHDHRYDPIPQKDYYQPHLPNAPVTTAEAVQIERLEAVISCKVRRGRSNNLPKLSSRPPNASSSASPVCR